MKYPYISTKSNNLLFYAKDTATLIGDESNFFSRGFKVTVDESDFENNTREYLANTYGEVVSPEHAEFIIELAELHGYKCGNFSPNRDGYFFAEGEWIRFTDSELHASNGGEKQITIPLPPKAKPKIYPQENLGEAHKHFDCVCNKCGGKCCTGQCDKQELSEWPVLGSKVIMSDEVGYVRLMPDSKGYYVIEVDGEYSQLTIEEFEKPKTPEEELRDDIVQTIHDDVYDGALGKQYLEVFANALMNKYNINKKPQ
jgi:hypothetical protein